jgi:hypothetical protein
MGLARIAIALLAVVAAIGLLIIGGVALWGALTSKDGDKPAGAAPSPSASPSAKPSTTRPAPPTRSAGQVGNTIVIHCLATQCPVFVSGPGPNDVQFNGNLTRDERRIFNETRLTVAVQDASTVTVTINGHLQPRGNHGPATYEAPPS